MAEAVSTYTARAAEKLREQDSLAARITVFLRTNAFREDMPQYSNSFTATRARKPPRFIRGMKRRSCMGRWGGECAELFDRTDGAC